MQIQKTIYPRGAIEEIIKIHKWTAELYKPQGWEKKHEKKVVAYRAELVAMVNF